MRSLTLAVVSLALLLATIPAIAQDKPARAGEWSQVTNSDGTPFGLALLPSRAGGGIYAMFGRISNETINKYWSMLDGGVAHMVRTKDGQPFQGLRPCTACGVAIAAQQVPDVPGGIRYWRITGTVAEPINGVDGAPFTLVPEYGDYEASAIAGPSPELCPYFVVRRGDRAPWLCRLDGLVARRVELPKEIVFPRCAWTGKNLIVGGGKKGFLLHDKEQVEIKDANGASLSTSAFVDLAFVGDLLLVNPGSASRCKLFRFSDAVATAIELPEGSSLLHLELASKQYFALLATQPTPGKWAYDLREVKDGKFLPTKALDPWQAYGTPTPHYFGGECLLECASIDKGWSLIAIAGGKAKVLISRPSTKSLMSSDGLTAGAAGNWLLKLGHAEPTYWRLSVAGPAKKLDLVDEVIGLKPGTGDALGFYATVQAQGDKQFLAYRRD